ncbi:hypothetical protein K432DRAFT_13827 [Lepidopterella palustris CBS 459.81]|uniref:Uncharacterized protein n=1 Tax=Lepidopterella palustris CBS 459.81 TaxID=1314670 RepID=A0A8E2JGL5_9PEZI|nr:hypothetical protein K432DRAFT_13827 [Lepidopterella palustris CBS 459.81]
MREWEPRLNQVPQGLMSLGSIPKNHPSNDDRHRTFSYGNDSLQQVYGRLFGSSLPDLHTAYTPAHHCLARGVQCDDLVADYIVLRCERGGYDECPGVVLFAMSGVLSPRPLDRYRRFTALVQLGPLQHHLIINRVAAASSDVVDHGAFVGCGQSVLLELHSVFGFGRHVGLA